LHAPQRHAPHIAAGEFDLLENVNKALQNQITIHTDEGCTMSPMSIAPIGIPLGTQCASSAGNNAGCAYRDKSTQSYGQGFNDAGGGVVVHLWDNTGVQVWFFPRGQVPNDVTQGSPNSCNWPPPVASFSATTCSMDHFYDHTLTFDITFCGDWAGAAYGASGCPGTCASAVADPNNFKSKGNPLFPWK